MINHSPQQKMIHIITSYWTSQAVYVAAKFGIADLLAEGPRPVEELAAETSTNTDALFRLLRALASVEIFQETEPRTFGLTPLAECLRSDVPGSQRALALMAGDEQYKAYAELAYSVETGKTAFDKVFGEPIFEYLADHPEKAQVFDAAMTSIHGKETQAVLDAYDFSDVRVLADVGGGNGSNLIATLRKYPEMEGMLFDLPHVAERAEQRIRDAGLEDRCRAIGGSFFESVPDGADAYLMRHIIHDWNDEQSLTILKNCRAAMPPDGKLLLVESVIPPGNNPFPAKLLDLTMLAIPGGKERTEQEYRELLGLASFELTQIVPTSTIMSVIEARSAERGAGNEGP